VAPFLSSGALPIVLSVIRIIRGRTLAGERVHADQVIAHARLKNDRVDANRLAYLLRADLLPKVSSDGVYDTAAFGRPDGLQAECTGGRDACH